MAGGKACLPICNVELPDCPARFDCVNNISANIPDPVCAPVGERCCVDQDGDLHGTGIGCLGTDCREDDPQTNSSATEVCDGRDNDCDGEIDDGDPDALCLRGEHVATTSCVSGTCEIIACEPNFADCNRMSADGCEQTTESASDCGSCGRPCTLPNAVTECVSGACRIASCLPGFGDCDRMAANGCEVELNTLVNCGACGEVCQLAHADETCARGTCEISACDPGFDDCDGIDATGCETSLRTISDCGRCGRTCAPSNGSGDCSTGTCRIAACNNGWGDCNFDNASCETSTRTNTNCGACGRACTIPGATTSCSTGSCNFTACDAGRSNCDANLGNGCELDHRAVRGACGAGAALYLGEREGDLSCGFGCPGNPLDTEAFATQTGVTSAWFEVRMVEDSICGARIAHTLELDVPPGANYNLLTYDSDGCTLLETSARATGLDETIELDRADRDFASDSFNYFVEVRYVSAGSCTPWALRIFGHDC